MKAYDAIIVGAGPNGLAAAITMQQQGLSTLLIEGADTIGGGMRSKELIWPGYTHDICSAIHPMAMASPFLRSIPLAKFGLRFVHAPIAAAHPLANGEAALLFQDVAETADQLGKDAKTYRHLIQPIVDNWEHLALATMGPLRFPQHPFQLASFGLKALPPADWIAKLFKTTKGKALWGGMAAHGLQPLSNWTTAAIGLVLMAVGNRYGWPIPVGGSQSIADALAAYYTSLGGEIRLHHWVDDIGKLPPHKVAVLDMTPKQLLQLKGTNLSNSYQRQLQRFRYGMGVFKVDYILSEPVPFQNKQTRQAATVHLGNTYAEVAHGEQETQRGKHVEKPFVLFAQPSVFDDSRAPLGEHTGWAYCHVPNGSSVDMTQYIDNQIERFAPGFKDCIRAKVSMNALDMEAYNPNYVGGDINGGIMDIRQLYTRPTLSLSPYRTANSSIYLCSSSTPPGGGVHGMCGFHAAKIALKDHFNKTVTL
ncbi:phytoene desaturase family protein [Sphingobacterium sp. MYb382]|uniref:phytoene desaturase family protein n=1 Tax=Sphingobacterium sp. MYb382 TaxID=2745278 RepID=UPI0030B11EB3